MLISIDFNCILSFVCLQKCDFLIKNTFVTSAVLSSLPSNAKTEGFRYYKNCVLEHTSFAYGSIFRWAISWRHRTSFKVSTRVHVHIIRLNVLRTPAHNIVVDHTAIPPIPLILVVTLGWTIVADEHNSNPSWEVAKTAKIKAIR